MGWKLSRWDSTVKESAPKVGRLPTLVTALKVSVPNGEGGDVDAMGGEELGVGGLVDGGDGVAGAVAASGGGCTFNGEGAAEQGTGLADLSGGDEVADAAGGDRMAAQDARRVDADGEAEFAAEGFEVVDAGLGLVAEAEVLAFVELVDADAVAEEILGEGAGGHAREVVREGQDDDGVEAGGAEEFEFLGEWGDEGQVGFGAEDAGGVWVEGDGYGGDAESASAVDDLGNDPLVAEMNAVEVADGGDARAPVGWEFRWMAVDAHQAGWTS